MNSTIRKGLPAALSVALVVGALAVPAIAATDDSGTDDTATESVEPTDDAAFEGRPHRRGGGGFLGGPGGLEDGDMAERLAAELGLDADTVQAAIDAVKADLAAEHLATAVEEGRLTQDQADRLLAAMEDGTIDEVRQEIHLEQLRTRLDEQVAAGELTQEEADEIEAAAEAGDFPGHGRGGRGGHHGPRGFGGGGPDDAADGTDATVEDTSV